MSKAWDRRRFVTAVLGAAPALAATVRSAVAMEHGGTRSAVRRAGAWPAAANGLPPRVIGLRTDGGNFRFDPVGLVVEPGARVVWLNMGDFHTTTAFHPDNGALVPGEMPLRIPEGAKPWHSGILGLTDGTEFAYTFDVEGVYDYFCQPHYMFGMVGRVVAGTPRGGPGTRPMDGLPDVVREKMPPLDLVVGRGERPNEWMARINGVLYLLASGEDPQASAAALRDALAGDAVLRRQTDDAGSTRAIAAAADAFVEAVRKGTDYETLVALADDVKTGLGALIS